MADRDDLEYYRRREAQCRRLAEKASDPGIKYVHREMAANYAMKMAELERKSESNVLSSRAA